MKKIARVLYSIKTTDQLFKKFEIYNEHTNNFVKGKQQWKRFC